MPLLRRVIANAVISAAVAQAFQSVAGSQKPEVRIAVDEQKFCSGSTKGYRVNERFAPGVITLRLRVRLFYGNPGARPLILQLSEDPTIILSRSLADTGTRTNQRAIRFRPPIPPPDLTDKGINLESPIYPFFEILQPGEESRMPLTEYVILPVYEPAAVGTGSDLLGKRVFLQLELAHIGLPERLARKLAVQWSQYGYLWTGKVRTEPIQVQIPMSPMTSDCSREYKID